MSAEVYAAIYSCAAVDGVALVVVISYFFEKCANIFFSFLLIFGLCLILLLIALYSCDPPSPSGSYFNCPAPSPIFLLPPSSRGSPYTPYIRHSPPLSSSTVTRLTKKGHVPTQHRSSTPHAPNQSSWLDSTVSEIVRHREHIDDDDDDASVGSDYSDYDSSASYLITSLNIRHCAKAKRKKCSHGLAGLYEAVSDTATPMRMRFTTQIDRIIYEQFRNRHIYALSGGGALDPAATILTLGSSSSSFSPISEDRTRHCDDCCSEASHASLDSSWEVVGDESSAPVITCAICLQDIADDTRLKLPCGHIFHKSCVVTWLGGTRSEAECFTNRCPTCNVTIEAASPSTQGSAELVNEALICEGHVTPSPTPLAPPTPHDAFAWASTMEDDNRMPLSVLRAVEDYKEQLIERQSSSDDDVKK